LASHKILIVEDFEDLRNLVSIYLGARGYDVLEACTGRAAIETAVSENPKLILLDFRLPDMDGLEVTRELHRLPQTEHIPIVGWSADCHSKPPKKVWRQAGLADCVQKPVSMREPEAVIDRFVPTP
jgi:DNA-binding response OmpR family regulator